jgi:outer membrane protein assembly factor BamD (BamD/ComL family)
MRDGLARKDLNDGLYYLKRNAFDSALIYFRDAVVKYPGTSAAHEAMIKMVEVYKRLKWMEDAGDVCRQLRSTHGADADVIKACLGIRADTTG